MSSYRTPAAVAAELGCPERTLRRKAREIGACHVLGKTMILTGEESEAEQ